MTLKILKLNPDAPTPTRAHDTDAGLDLYCLEQVTVSVGQHNKIRTGIAVAIPAGHVGYVTPRSGLASRHGVTVLNAPGTVDSGFTGELRVLLINHGTAPVTLRPGDRIAQLVIQPIITPTVEEVAALETSQRGDGAFGSTGK